MTQVTKNKFSTADEPFLIISSSRYLCPFNLPTIVVRYQRVFVLRLLSGIISPSSFRRKVPSESRSERCKTSCLHLISEPYLSHARLRQGTYVGEEPPVQCGQYNSDERVAGTKPVVDFLITR